MDTGSTPTAHYTDGHVTVYHGDCRDILAQLPDDSVDSIVTDPPYGIEFMGKQWDAFAPEVAASTAARTGSKLQRNDGGIHEHSVLGGSLPVFGGNRSRTFACTRCGKRDQFRNPHKCDGEADARWESIVINPDGAPAASIGFQQWCTEWARECLRVLKPGGHLLAFGGTRTYHRLACAIEDAGFDIRDSIHWVYGSGFPKSMNISKQIDKQAGAVGEVIGEKRFGTTSTGQNSGWNANAVAATGRQDIVAPATDDAQQWHGWGTALKPAHEPIVVARKPPRDTITNNVLRYGTGALNIDATRIPHDDTVNLDRQQRQQHADGIIDFGAASRIGTEIPTYKPEGRWPANFIHDGSPEVLEHFPRAKGGAYPTTRGDSIATDFASGQPTEGGARAMGDDGSAARFFNTTPYTDLDGQSFIYCAKANTRERNAGLHELPEKLGGSLAGGNDKRNGDKPQLTPRANFHPTVKPLALMRHLIRLVTPPGGTILEPFAGSGTTLAAATLEGFDAIGIELTADYLPIITGRLQWATEQHANEHPTLF
jgi:DNA modification methylase